MKAELESKIKSSLVNGKLPCPAAFQIAKELDLSISEVGNAVDDLKIKVSDCQLGLFGKPHQPA